MRRIHCLTVALLLSSLLLPSVAAASPWVQKPGEFIVSGRFDFQVAEREFLDEGGAQQFPLEGSYRSAQFVSSIRFGLVDNLELQFDVPLQVTSYTSEPVILLPGGEDAGIDYYQENTIDLSESVAGVSDVRMAGRYQFLTGAFAGAVEINAKLPTGYDRPAGTFGREPEDVEDFQENIGTYVQPDNVADDVTLGDGQVDLGALALFGWAFPSKTFLRLDAGYRLRLRGGGDQFVSRLKVGQGIGKRVLLYAAGGLDYAVQDGEIIGVSVAAEDPSLPAEEYGGTTNLDLREVPLDYDRFTIRGGVIIKVTDTVEMTVDYSRVLWGRNTSLVNALSMGISAKFGDSGG